MLQLWKKKKEKRWKYKSESERALHVTLLCHKYVKTADS